VAPTAQRAGGASFRCERAHQSGERAALHGPSARPALPAERAAVVSVASMCVYFLVRRHLRMHPRLQRPEAVDQLGQWVNAAPACRHSRPR
jgi:hypothetical protein